jgi:hypothetical protein
MLLTALLAGWALAFAYSFQQLGEGAYEFLRWQGVAGILAVAVYGVSLSWPRLSAVRSVGVLPLTLAVLVAAGLALFVFLKR